MDKPFLLKLVIAGPSGAGQTTFLHTVEPSYVDFAFMDLGEGSGLEIYGSTPPTHEQHLEVWPVLMVACAGCIFLIDSSRPETFSMARYTIETLQKMKPTPFVIAANKQNAPGALAVDEIQRQLEPGEDARIVPCTATDQESVRHVLFELLKLMAAA